MKSDVPNPIHRGLPRPGSRAFIPGLRWYILGLIFLATCINYVDRSSVGLLFTRFGPEIGISRQQYGWVGAILLLAYTVSQSVSGRLYDRYGARAGFTLSIVVWCAAAMAHSAIVGFGSFAVCSFFLGLGEAGNWPGSAKVVAEWFPQRERAIGMAIFNGGASMGGVLAPLLVGGWLDPLFGWRRTFLIVGALGFIWLLAWLAVYRPISDHPRLSPDEKRSIQEGQTAKDLAIPPPSMARLLSLRETWGILLARFLVDPIWWLYMLWLPAYLNDVYHFSLQKIGVFQWAPYLCAALGSLFGGWLSSKLIARGKTVNAARKIAIAGAACLMPFGIFAARASNPMIALALIAVVLFGFQMWITNVQTLPSDIFPSSAVGSVAGMGGTAAGISSLLFNLGTGWLVTHFGYAVVLTLAGILAPIGAVVLFVLVGVIHRIPANHPTLQTH
ncbi:MAG TPA: MFS transporter [Acidobacteriaceae bacterium]|nr:MFS transporter [Acidobacteriaceae bacterium]